MSNVIWGRSGSSRSHPRSQLACRSAERWQVARCPSVPGLRGPPLQHPAQHPLFESCLALLTPTKPATGRCRIPWEPRVWGILQPCYTPAAYSTHCSLESPKTWWTPAPVASVGAPGREPARLSLGMAPEPGTELLIIHVELYLKGKKGRKKKSKISSSSSPRDEAIYNPAAVTDLGFSRGICP